MILAKKINKERKKKKIAQKQQCKYTFQSLRLRFTLRLMKTNEMVFVLFVRVIASAYRLHRYPSIARAYCFQYHHILNLKTLCFLQKKKLCINSMRYSFRQNDGHRT